MEKFIVFSLCLALGSLASAQNQACNCNSLRTCAEQKRAQKEQAHAACEQNCISSSFGANAQAVQACFQQKKGQMQAKRGQMENCMLTQANICTGAGRMKRHFMEISENTEFLEEDREKRNAMGIPEMQGFKTCMSGCMQQQGGGRGRRGAGGGGLNDCATEQNCLLDPAAIRAAKEACKQQSQPFNPADHQQGCTCLRTALKKTEAEMPCTGGPRTGGRFRQGNNGFF